MLEALGGDESRLVRALKLVTQNVVLHATSALRAGVLRDLPLTKDVRGPDGWQVFLECHGARYQVRHVLHEQSVDAFGDTANHFEFTFSVSATIDLGSQASKGRGVLASWLRIEDVSLAPTVEPKLRARLQGALGSGVRIVGGSDLGTTATATTATSHASPA